MGHELIGDREGLGNVIAIAQQIKAGDDNPAAVTLFRQAITNDMEGRHDERDNVLRQILNLDDPTADFQADRIGNSIQDLRLSARCQDIADNKMSEITAKT